MAGQKAVMLHIRHCKTLFYKINLKFFAEIHFKY